GVSGGEISSETMELVKAPSLERIKGDAKACRAGDRFGGRAVTETLRDPKSGITVEWRAELREGANYVRSLITVTGGATACELQKVALLDVKGANAVVMGQVPGSPVVIGQTFFGVELPFPRSSVGPDGFSSAFDCKLPLGQGTVYTFATVTGVVPEGQLRRGFLCYLERERARPYKPFLHYNCWFDLERGVNEKDMLSRIGAFTEEMTVKRGVAMQSYVLDDGWDDYNAGFWAIHKTKFPAGFDRLAAELDRVKSHLGIWISPLAGYDGSGQRVEQARKLGLVSGGWLDLSDPKYYKWFRDTCANLVTKNKVNYFKWDKAGNGVSPHFMALLACARELRQINPDLFLNVTVGTWPSPFWLNAIDSTWREGSDMGWEGKGDDREMWINYRDAQTYRFVVKQGPLYPLNSIMNHGVVMARGHFFAARAARAGNELRHEARSFFGSGTAVQELYIQPDLMATSSWDAVATAAKWAYQNADVLVDTHWVGGDPAKPEIYGWASWSPKKAILTLRNPDDQPREITLDAAVVFELPADAARNFTMTSPYADQRVQKVEMAAGKPTPFSLQPFEVLVLESKPTRLK
ncbi:MAG: alpha-galactosidase, partial [bacterium]